MKIMRKIFSVFAATAMIAGAGLAVSAPAANAASCTKLTVASKDGRVLYLWKCGTELHGQLANASTGDLAYLRAPGGQTTGGKRVAAGKTSVNTGNASGKWAACVAVKNRPGKDWCTAYKS